MISSPTRFAAVLAIVLTGAISLPGIASATTPGTELWAKRYNGPGNSYDFAHALGVSPDGSVVFVAGDSYSPTSLYDYATAAYDASTGAKLWSKLYNGPANSQDGATAIGVSPDGSEVFVTGTSFGVSEHDWATVAYDASTGAKLWAKRYNDPLNGGDYAYALGVSPDGSQVFVTGRSDGLGYPGYATVAYDAATGNRLWVKTYNGPGYSDYPTALGVSPDGSVVFVTGQSASPPSGESDYATVAYDADTGAKLWLRRFNGPANGHDFATALRLSPDGSVVFVTGASNRAEFGTPDGFDYATVAYDASTGTQLWAKRYNGPGNLEDTANALGVSPDGSKVFVTGRSFGSTSYNDYATVAYDASTGAKLWSKRYDADSNGDSATALAVSPDGSEVFVTGASIGAASVDDYATFAYDASTGAKLWLKRYNGPGNSFDDAAALGVSPDGSKIFVTGTSRGSTTFDDYATVAYAVG
jgi:hypothetical protein